MTPEGVGHDGCVLMIILAVSALLTVSHAAGAADVVSGKQIFDSDCAVCHKPDGSGGVKLGTASSADLRAPDLEKLYHEDDALIARSILRGKDQDGEPLNPVMPRYGGRITRQEVNAVIAYLKTLHQ